MKITTYWKPALLLSTLMLGVSYWKKYYSISKHSLVNISSQTQSRILSSSNDNNFNIPEYFNAPTHFSALRFLNIQELHLDPRKYLFLHPGKSGGGTFDERVKGIWNIKISQCHPYPCPSNNKRNKVRFITVRDPVDKFESAFNWRLIIFCNPNGDNREPASSSFLSPETKCTKQNGKEIDILFHKYQQNVNMLAESLCSKNEKKKQEAENDVGLIGHMNHLVEWLGDGKDWERLVPIVLEENYDFNEGIDQAVRWTQQHYQMEDPSVFSRREKVVAEKNNEEPPKSSEKKMHSSKKHYSKIKEGPALSNEGKRCLYHYFEKDYSLINQLKNKACKYNDCKQAFQSILNRRSHFLRVF